MSWTEKLAALAPRIDPASGAILGYGARSDADDYAALTGGAGLFALGPRTRIELRGTDRAAFLHNLTTNDIKALPPGRGCEAFVLNAQGKILFLVTVSAGDERHVVDTVADGHERLAAHLDRYLIREKVEIADVSDQWLHLLVAGPQAEEVMSAAFGQAGPDAWLANRVVRLGDAEIEIRRTDMTGPVEFQLSIPASEFGSLAAALVACGAAPVGRGAFEAARIERGTPWPNVDVTEANLPQEVGRDARTLSFTKGCYLGQETVARIDALGHVNRKLVRLRFLDPEAKPAVGVEDDLRRDGKPVGKLTSVAYSPGLQRPVALAYVRRGSTDGGTRLETPWGAAEVVEKG